MFFTFLLRYLLNQMTIESSIVKQRSFTQSNIGPYVNSRMEWNLECAHADAINIYLYFHQILRKLL